MLSKPILQKIWLIIERLIGKEVTHLSDLELLEKVQQQVLQESTLTESEKQETASYIQAKIPFIRDLAEIQQITNSRKKELV